MNATKLAEVSEFLGKGAEEKSLTTFGSLRLTYAPQDWRESPSMVCLRDMQNMCETQTETQGNLCYKGSKVNVVPCELSI